MQTNLFSATMDTNFMNLVAIVKVYHLTLVVTLYFSRIKKLQFLFSPSCGSTWRPTWSTVGSMPSSPTYSRTCAAPHTSHPMILSATSTLQHQSQIGRGGSIQLPSQYHSEGYRSLIATLGTVSEKATCVPVWSARVCWEEEMMFVKVLSPLVGRGSRQFSSDTIVETSLRSGTTRET